MGTSITCLGGGHGLFATLRAARKLSDDVTAVVTVADDGGSSGRLRRELGQIPPGDLRMAIAALSGADAQGRLWEEVLQHRFGGSGAMAGHAVGNLLIAGLTEVLGDPVQALAITAKLAGVRGAVVPMSDVPLDIEGEVSGLEDDPRIVRTVRGQVAVASTPGEMRRVRLIPTDPPANEQSLMAVARADLVTLGPGSWFSSVLPHLMVPRLLDALERTRAKKVLVLNLVAQPGETTGFSAERHIHVIASHAPRLHIDEIIVDERTATTSGERRYLARAAERLGATVVFADVQREDSAGRLVATHDWDKLAAALAAALSR